MHGKISTLKVYTQLLNLLNLSYHVNANKENQFFKSIHKLSQVPYCSNKHLTNFFLFFFKKNLRMLLKPSASAIRYTKENELFPRRKAELSKGIKDISLKQK